VNSLPPLYERQLTRLLDVYPSAHVEHRPDGSALITVPDLSLPDPDAWDRAAITIAINIPAGYPTAKPSGFETAPDLRLKNGAMPAAGRGEHSIDGLPYAHFCWQPNQQWENDENELWKRVKFALMRFADVKG
jgi:Prokaryotic E2 family E